MTPSRSPFLGVTNVVRFNWPMFAMAGLTVAGCMLGAWLLPMPTVGRWLFALTGAATFAQVLLALAATHWAYDRSSLYHFEWKRHLPSPPATIANFHAGFDETSTALTQLFPGSTVRAFDFYDPARTTEPSIVRARRLYPSEHPSEPISVAHLPLASDSQDLVLGFLAVHEIRQEEDRAALFSEFARVLTPPGRLVIVEHLRDLPNFCAYGLGAFHFHSRATWLRAIEGARLRVAHEAPITPFIRLFVCCPSS